MNNLRVVIALAGSLTAVMAGAETARWGLAPLSAAEERPASEIVSTDAAPTPQPAAYVTDSVSGAAPAATANWRSATATSTPVRDPPAEAPRHVDQPIQEAVAETDDSALGPPIDARPLPALPDVGPPQVDSPDRGWPRDEDDGVNASPDPD